MMLLLHSCHVCLEISPFISHYTTDVNKARTLKAKVKAKAN